MGNSRASASIAILKNRVMVFKDARIAELGCGDGSLVVEVANALGIRDIYGVDINNSVLKKATNKGIKVFKTDLNSDLLPFKDSFFDVVLMEEVIEHLVNPDNAIREAYRVLKAGGLFLVSTPNLAWWLNRLALLFGYQPYWSECSTIYNVGKFKRNQKQPLSGHLRLYTYKALKQLLELYGFQVIASKGVTYNNLPSVFKHLDRLISKMPSLAQIVMVLAQK
jgi:methionine biosynthesis protein MetW